MNKRKLWGGAAVVGLAAQDEAESLVGGGLQHDRLSDRGGPLLSEVRPAGPARDRGALDVGELPPRGAQRPHAPVDATPGHPEAGRRPRGGSRWALTAARADSPPGTCAGIASPWLMLTRRRTVPPPTPPLGLPRHHEAPHAGQRHAAGGLRVGGSAPGGIRTDDLRLQRRPRPASTSAGRGRFRDFSRHSRLLAPASDGPGVTGVVTACWAQPKSKPPVNFPAVADSNYSHLPGLFRDLVHDSIVPNANA